MAKDDYLNTPEFWERKNKEIKEMEEEKRISADVGPWTGREIIVINKKQTLGLGAYNCWHCKIISATETLKEVVVPFALEIQNGGSRYYICLECLRDFMDKELIMDNL